MAPVGASIPIVNTLLFSNAGNSSLISGALGHPGIVFTNFSNSSTANYILSPPILQNSITNIKLEEVDSQSSDVKLVKQVLGSLTHSEPPSIVSMKNAVTLASAPLIPGFMTNLSTTIKQEVPDAEKKFETNAVRAECVNVSNPRGFLIMKSGKVAIPCNSSSFMLNAPHLSQKSKPSSSDSNLNTENKSCEQAIKTADSADKPDELIAELEDLKKQYVDNKCQICGFSSKRKRKSNGWKHMMVHLKTRSYKCDICERTFKEYESLKNHVLVHGDLYPFSCRTCKKVFRRKNDLSLHCKTKHSDVEVAAFSCRVCAKAFVSRSRLKRHLRSHTGEKRYSCVYCNQGFTKEDAFDAHLNKHKAIKPYKCDECGKDFHGRNYLQQHINMHAKTNIYKCKECHLTFNFHSNLIQHSRIHSKQRRYECTLCDKAFKFPHHMKQHLATHKDDLDDTADEPDIKEEMSESDFEK